jgi:hypothetical protein
MSTSLTARGSIGVASTGTFDWGTASSPISIDYSSTIVLNYSLSPSATKHIFAAMVGSSVFLYSALQKTRNTTLTSNVSASINIIQVNQATNWQPGDRIVIETDTTSLGRTFSTTIASITGTNVTLAAGLNFARSAGIRLSNLSSNITIKPHNGSLYPTNFVWGADSSDSIKFVCNNVRFEDLGSRATWLNSGSLSPWNQGSSSAGLSLVIGNLVSNPVVESCAFEEVNLYSTGSGASLIIARYALGITAPSAGSLAFKNCACYLIGTTTANSYGAYIVSGANAIFENCNWYNVGRIALAFGEGSGDSLFKNCFIHTTGVDGTGGVGVAAFNNTSFKCLSALTSPGTFSDSNCRS